MRQRKNVSLRKILRIMANNDKNQFTELLEEHITRDNLISCCRFYNGEELSPYPAQTEKSMLWFCEMAWVENMLRHADYAGILMSEYEAVGLSTFCANDIVPMSLKAQIFFFFAKGFYSAMQAAEPFKEFYSKHYH